MNYRLRSIYNDICLDGVNFLLTVWVCVSENIGGALSYMTKPNYQAKVYISNPD